MPSLSVAEAIRNRADTILGMNSYIGLFEWLIFAAISAMRVNFIFGSNVICLERWLAPKLLPVCVDPPAPETYVCACWLHDGKLHNAHYDSRGIFRMNHYLYATKIAGAITGINMGEIPKEKSDAENTARRAGYTLKKQSQMGTAGSKQC